MEYFVYKNKETGHYYTGKRVEDGTRPSPNIDTPNIRDAEKFNETLFWINVWSRDYNRVEYNEELRNARKEKLNAIKKGR